MGVLCREETCDKPDEDPDHSESENYTLEAQQKAEAVLWRLTSFLAEAQRLATIRSVVEARHCARSAL